MTPVTRLCTVKRELLKAQFKTPEVESFQLENEHISGVKCASRVHYSTGGPVLSGRVNGPAAAQRTAALKRGLASRAPGLLAGV